MMGVGAKRALGLYRRLCTKAVVGFFMMELDSILSPSELPAYFLAVKYVFEPPRVFRRLF